jgi:hypothetical protein
MLVDSLSVSPPSCHCSFPVNPLVSRLCPADQVEYLRLVNAFASSEDRNKRNMGMSTFVKHLGMIHTFVCRGDSFDSLRGVVCGIEFGPGSVLINTRQLKKLMFRSKSCMNGCFQRLGYAACRPSRDVESLFAQILPGWGAQLFTSRQWCVRRAVDSHAVTFQPNVHCELAADGDPPAGGPAPNSAFIFNIRNLLNHPPPDADFRPICDSELPPLRG